MSRNRQEEPSKIVMLAPVAIVLVVYSFLFHSPQQSELQGAQQRYDSLSSADHDTEHELEDTRIASTRVRKERREVDSRIDELTKEKERLLAERNRMRRQLEQPSRPAATMQRVTSLMARHRLQVLESQPESGATLRASKVLGPVVDLLVDDPATTGAARSGEIDGREIYQLKVRGRFQDLHAALGALAVQLDHVLPLSLQMEPLELESQEARQSQRVWTLTILV